MSLSSIDVFDALESEVRSYIRSYPALFSKAKGSLIYDQSGKAYIDFFGGAGSLNYGHNHPKIIKKVVDYLLADGIVQSLDMATEAKEIFLKEFNRVIQSPRHLSYKIQFAGPTGTNGIECALKIARMAKKRPGIIAFTNSYHGHSLGSLAVTSNSYYKNSYFGIPGNTVFMPFDKYLGKDIDTLEILKKYLDDCSSGVDTPAGIILETIQIEGGINVASNQWLQELSEICRQYDILLIVDDIQAGIGRTGKFFSFENAGLKPDIVVLSKSIGSGFPLSCVLMKPEIDVWKPGQHTGTFRGNNISFVAGTAALEFWEEETFEKSIAEKSLNLKSGLEEICQRFPNLNMAVRGQGMLYGLEILPDGFAPKVSRKAFKNGLLIELAGAKGSVLKFLPALNIPNQLLTEGLKIVKQSIQDVIKG